MSLQTDIVNLLVRVNGDKAKKEFSELKSKAAQLSAELKTMKKGTQEFEDKSKELALVQSRFKALRGEMDLNSLSIKDLRQEIAKMKSIRNELDPTSKEFTTLGERIHIAEGRMRELNQGGNFLSRTFEFLKKEAMGFGVVMLGALGIDYVIGKIGNLIQRNAELADSYSDIRKVTNFTVKETEELTKSISKIDTRTARKELLLLAVEGGRLGIEGVENIKGFVEEANKIKVALGDDLSDEAIREVGKLTNVYKVGEQTGKDFAQSMNALGSSINAVSASGSSQADFLVDYLKRQAGIASQTKLSASNNIAYAATFDELGQSVEVSATAMNKVWMDLYSNTNKYAKIAGVSVKDFKAILEKDANQAMLMFLDGLNKTNGGFDIMLELLGDLEVGGARGAQAILALASNTERLKVIQEGSNKAITEATSLNNEYALKNENLAGKVEKLQKRFAALFVSETMNSWVESGVDGANTFINSIERTANWIQKNCYLIKALTVAYIAYYVASGKLIAIKIIELALSKARAALLVIETIATNAFAVSMMLLTGNFSAAIIAMRAWTAALAVNPIIAITAVIIGLYTAIDSYVRKMGEAKLAGQEAFDNERTKDILQQRTKNLNDYNSRIEDIIKTAGKRKLTFELNELDAAQIAREKELKQLEDNVKRREQISRSHPSMLAVLDGYEEAEKKQRTTLLENAKQNLKEATATYDEYKNSRKRISDAIIALDNKQAASAKELTDKEKAELEKRRRAQEKYLDDLRKYNDELIKLNDAVEKAKIQAIEEENARELLALEESKKEKIHAAEKSIRDQIERAKDLHILTAAVEKEYAEKLSFLKLGIEEQYQRDRTALILKHQDERQKQIETSYSNELKVLNNSIETQKLLFAHLYKDGEISKNEYDTRLKNLDLTSKSELLEIAKRYGIDVTKAELDLLLKQLEIIEDGNERKKALLQREADFRVALAQYNSSKNPNSKDAQEELLRAQLNQLQVQMENEIQLHIGHEEEILQIRAEYDLKKQQLDEEFHAGTIARGADAAAMYIGIFNDAAQKIFDFRGQKIEQELQATQTKISKEQASLDQQYKNKLLSDVDYNARKKANQDKLDRAEREAKRKKAINDKLAAVFNILLQTAQGIATAVAQSPMTGGLPGSAIAAAMGALELAFVAAQPIPQYFTGGYADKRKVKGASDGRTYDAKILPGFGSGYLANPALVLAGERGEEYFVNNTMLNNPAVKYVVDGIDQLTKGNISSPDFQAMLALPALQQKFTGGYIGSTSTQAPIFKHQDNTKDIYGDMMIQVANTLNRLNDHLDVGIKSEAKIGDNTIVKFNERNDYLKSIVDDAN